MDCVVCALLKYYTKIKRELYNIYFNYIKSFIRKIFIVVIIYFKEKY